LSLALFGCAIAQAATLQHNTLPLPIIQVRIIQGRYSPFISLTEKSHGRILQRKRYASCTDL
jgi:hypothetical protein